MITNWQHVMPDEIEKRSFELIEDELASPLPELFAPIIKRVIHTTADFSYAETLCFSDGAVDGALAALRRGASIVTDTNMGRSGINKKRLAALGGEAYCFIADEDVAAAASQNGTTRAVAAVDKAAGIDGELIFAVGNAPTALRRICELVRVGEIAPALIIGVPVGFVNVVESKEMLLESSAPFIVSRGRKGGSNVAAAICNALLYML